MLLSNWCNLSSYITTALETKRFARLYVNLKSSVNEEYVAYRKMVKIWQLWRVPVSRNTILYKNLNLLLKGCICPNVLVKLSYLQQVKFWKKKNYYQNIEGNTSFQWQVQVFASNNMPWRRNSSKFPKSWPLFHTQQILHLSIIPNLHTLAFPELW